MTTKDTDLTALNALPAELSGRNVAYLDADLSESEEEREARELLAKKDWTQAEEDAARRKVDLIVMPLLILAFFALQLDRGNIGNTLTDNFLADVGITQNQFNVGQQLLSLGIVLLEVPANLVLYRIGAQRWLSIQVVAWGLVSTFQSFQHGLAAFLVTRLLLGLTEGGFIPGGLFVITSWYTRAETAKRFAIYFIGNLFASASTGLISYGILHMRGVAGWAGWRWLFLICGLITIVIGFILALFLPGSYDSPHPWLLPKLTYFTERELYILKWRVIIDSPPKGKKKSHITWPELKSALSNWRIWPHVFITLSAAAPLTAISSYSPSLVYSFGYSRLRSNALASVGPFIVIVTSTLWGFFSDYTGHRGTAVISALVVYLGAITMNTVVTTSNSKSLRYGAIVFVQSFSVIFHPQNGAWLALNTKTPAERAVAMSLFIVGANAAGIIGAQLFRSDDKPRYKRGWKVATALVSFGLFLAILQALQYQWTARRAKRQAIASDVSDEVSDEEREKGSPTPSR